MRDTSELSQLKAYAKAEIKAGRQIHWDIAFAISRPSLSNIRDWYDDLPPGLNKDQAIQWLVEKANKHVNH